MMFMAVARWLRRRFLKVIATEYLIVVLAVVGAHFSQTRAYGFLFEAALELAAIQVAAEDRRYTDVHEYRMDKIEERVDALQRKVEEEAESIRTSTFWILGTFVGTMMSVLTSTIVYIVVSRRREEASDD